MERRLVQRRSINMEALQPLFTDGKNPPDPSQWPTRRGDWYQRYTPELHELTIIIALTEYKVRRSTFYGPYRALVTYQQRRSFCLHQLEIMCKCQNSRYINNWHSTVRKS